ncbi:MAG: Panacea domain-containing protein, partial [Dermatophilaceae bacterium]
MVTADDIQFTHHIEPLDAAAFFVRADHLRDEPDVTPMKLQKLLYLAQANYLAATGERLFDADVEAFEHGPAVYSVWQAYNGTQIIDPNTPAGTDARPLPADIEAFLGAVWTRYQDWTASALRHLSHRQAPWREHYVERAFRHPIPDDAMTAYFRHQVPAG